MSIPEPAEAAKLLEQAATSDAVQLFAKFASRVKSDFKIGLNNVGTVIEICRYLEGIPFAIRIAAVRLETSGLQALAKSVRDRFSGLKNPGPPDLAHHVTLRASIDWSYDKLCEADQRLLLRLAVFQGGWELNAAETVCWFDQPGNFPELHDRLVQKSLIEIEDVSGDRFRMLETVRNYCAEKLTPGERITLQSQLLKYYAELAKQHEEAQGTRDEARALVSLDREQDNLGAALDTRVDCAQTMEHVLTLAASLRWFWARRGHFAEGRKSMDRALAFAAPPSAPLAKALSAAGWLAHAQGAFETAMQFYSRSADTWELLNSPLGGARALTGCARAAREMGDTARAEKWYTQVTRLLAIRQAGAARSDKESLVVTYEVLNGLGVIMSDKGQYASAEKHIEGAIDVANKLEDRYRLIIPYNDLGVMKRNQGDYAEAKRLHELTIKLLEDYSDVARSAIVRYNLGIIALSETPPQCELARVQFTASLDVAQKVETRGQLRWRWKASPGSMGSATCTSGDRDVCGGRPAEDPDAGSCGAERASGPRCRAQGGRGGGFWRSCAGCLAARQIVVA